MLRRELTQLITDAIANAQRDGALPSFSLPSITLEHPDVSGHGDYATNVALVIGKMIGKNPRDVAESIITKLPTKTSPQPSPRRRGEMDGIIDQIEIAGPGFINFWLRDEWLVSVVQQISKEKKKFGTSKDGKGKTVIVEYSSPNIAKPMGIQHLRSTIIGQALYNIYTALGYRVIGDNHIGDFGTQFGKLIVAWRLWAKEMVGARALTINDLLQLYIRFHNEVKKNASLNDRAREETKKLQEKEKKNVRLWKQFVTLSMKEFNLVYKRLGIRFDAVLGESFYDSLLSDIVADVRTKGVAEASDGATVIFMPDVSKDPYIIQKSDGAYLYSTTDLATIRYREKKWHPDRVLYVVANQQALHFSQLFRTATLLGYAGAEKLTHVKFGMVLGKDGKKLATREGKVIALEEVMDEAVARATRILDQQITNHKSQITNEKEKACVAEVIGIGALKYNDLSQHRQTDIFVDWDKMLSLTGNSAPYLQYVVVRIRSILKKAPVVETFGLTTGQAKNHPSSRDHRSHYGAGKITKSKNHKNFTPDERALLRLLYRFPDIIRDAAEKNEPI